MYNTPLDILATKILEKYINKPKTMDITDKYLIQWIKETYPLMTTNDDLCELDYYDMEKFSKWLVKNSDGVLIDFIKWYNPELNDDDADNIIDYFKNRTK